MTTAAIIVAAGSSRRMGFNKLLAPLAGEPVIVHTVRQFEACSGIHSIIVVGGDEVADALNRSGCSKLKTIVAGGAERHFSVAAGLAALPANADLVAVHDGGRPLIGVAQIDKCISAAATHGAVSCARRATETMKECDDRGQIVGSIPRERAWIMETPQVFRRDLLEKAYSQVLADGALVTDEVSALQHIQVPVWVVENTSANPKITFPADLALAETLLSNRKRS